MGVDVSTDIVILRPREEVATYAADPDHAPEWYVNIKCVRWQTPRPARVGSQVTFVAHFLGRTFEYTYEVVEFVPGHRVVMRTAEGPFPMETSYVWTSTEANSTHMTLRNRGEPTGFSKLSAPFMATAMRRANRKDLRRLKEILERDWP